LTYQGQGTRKAGVKPQDHAIIYTEDKKKIGGKSKRGSEKPTEAEGEEKLSKRPIRMAPKTSRDQLDPLSRLNYAKIYTVEYNLKVHFIGEIHRDSIKYFTRYFNSTHQPLPEGEGEDYSEEEELHDNELLYDDEQWEEVPQPQHRSWHNP
jgi:hypothetical protein